jgi:nitrous oxide reductase accessory protein NosL
MKTRYLAIALTLASLSAIACATRSLSPEALPLDLVECARCRMLISTESGSGEIVSATEDTRFYDDIGCLAADWAAHHGEARAFVRTAGGRWSDAQAASFAHLADGRTAMGSGLAAFPTAAAAGAADRTGRALTFDDVLHLPGAQR